MKNQIIRGMCEAEYRALPAISRSDILAFMVSPLNYWWNSPMNPAREERDSTKEMDLGTARHCYLLERDKFYERFAIYPEIPDGCLVTAEDIKGWMRDRDIPGISGKKEDLVARVMAYSEPPMIWDNIVSNFLAQNEGKSIIKKPDMDDVLFASKILSLYPEAMEIFDGAETEVVMVWTDEETGLLLKARADIFHTDGLADLKTFSNTRGREINKAICGSILYDKLYLQAKFYLEGFEAITKREGIFNFIFQQTEKPCEVRVKTFQRSAHKGASTNAYWSQADLEIRAALSGIKEYSEQYGNAPWIEMYRRKTALDDSEMPGIIYQ